MKMDYSDDWFWLRDKDKGFDFGDDTAAVSVKTEKQEKTADRKFSHWFQGTAAVSAKGEKPEKTAGLVELSRSFQDVFLDEEESDVTLNVGGEKYPAHKIIIRARSPVFYAMLKNAMKEKNQRFVDIPDCDPQIFRDFLFYLYTGKLDNIKKENVCELYYLADKYNVKELKMECSEFLFSNLSVGTICQTMVVTAKHSEPELFRQAAAFFIENAKDILQTDGWQRFVKDYPTIANALYVKAFNKVSEK